MTMKPKLVVDVLNFLGGFGMLMFGLTGLILARTGVSFEIALQGALVLLCFIVLIEDMARSRFIENKRTAGLKQG